MLKTLFDKYKYCAVGILIAANCTIVSVFRLEGISFGLVILAFCCTLQFFVKNDDQDKSGERKLDLISENLFHKIMDIVPGTIYVSQFDGTVKYVSDGIEKITGYKPDEIYESGNFLLQLIHPDDKEKVVQQIQKLQNGSHATIEYRLLRRDGTYVWVSDCLNTIKNEWGNITCYNGVLVNVDEKKVHIRNSQTLSAKIHHLNNMVNHYAVRDSLTNAYNKRYMMVILQNEFNRARVQNKPLACILMDIDHLESINHSYGYSVGDRILVDVCKCLQKNLNSSNIISRFEDDEFLIVLPEIGSEELRKISAHLKSEVERCSIKEEDKNMTIGFQITVGESTVIAKTKTINDLIEQTRRALYAAKKAKKSI